uniref:type II secretion system F family protein n=1 Tax=uncultured Bifidobacterium sp. TaxID=165187 RepID=UPI00262D62D5
PILEALDIVGSTSGNYVVETACTKVSDEVEKGRRLSDAMAGQPVFPGMMVQMVVSGEDSGAIDQMLDKAGISFDEEAQTTAKQLTSLLEPLMIVVLGAVVGFMVVALYMPMFSMFNAIDSLSS